MIPCTPNGELARELRLIVEQEQREGIKLKIIETGGRTIKSQIQKSNPTATPGCSNGDCVACSGGRGAIVESPMFSTVCAASCALKKTPQYILVKLHEICTQEQKNTFQITSLKRRTALF